MKLSTILPTLALLAPAMGNPIESRDIAAIKSVLTNINTQVKGLDTAINAQPLDAPTIVKKSNALAKTITDGTSNVNSQAALNDIDALGLVSPTQDLADDTETAIQDLIGIKGQVIDLGKGCVSLNSLQDLNKAAKGLSAAIVDKVPQSLNDIAGNLSDKIAGAIQKGVDAYQGSCDKKEAASQAASVKEDSPSKAPQGACQAPQ